LRLGILKEAAPGETRVALLPDSVKALVAQGLEVYVEQGAGLLAGVADEAYAVAGATLTSDRTALLGSADLLPVVNAPDETSQRLLKSGAVVAGFLRPLDDPAVLLPAIERGVTLFAMELVPRISRAQAMDALSSMATIAGYKAAVLAASSLPKLFPLLMTAAGTVPPAKVFVIGAGVAGLQAIATARRLGAVVEAYDVRAAAGEQVRSLGAKFLDVDLGGIDTEDNLDSISPHQSDHEQNARNSCHTRFNPEAPSQWILHWFNLTIRKTVLLLSKQEEHCNAP